MVNRIRIMIMNQNTRKVEGVIAIKTKLSLENRNSHILLILHKGGRS